MHLWIFARAARFIVLASLAVAGCGGEGATNPAVSDGTTTPADSIPDPNPDRLAITFSYGANSSPLSLFQMTKDGRLTTPFFSSAKYDLLPEWSNDGKKLVRTSGGGDEASLWVANADLTGLRQLGAPDTSAGAGCQRRLGVGTKPRAYRSGPCHRHEARQAIGQAGLSSSRMPPTRRIRSRLRRRCGSPARAR